MTARLHGLAVYDLIESRTNSDRPVISRNTQHVSYETAYARVYPRISAFYFAATRQQLPVLSDLLALYVRSG